MEHLPGKSAIRDLYVLVGSNLYWKRFKLHIAFRPLQHECSEQIWRPAIEYCSYVRSPHLTFGIKFVENSYAFGKVDADSP